MHNELSKFISERDKYLTNINNEILQERELASIAHSILSISKSLAPCELTIKEREAAEWAENYLQSCI